MQTPPPRNHPLRLPLLLLLAVAATTACQPGEPRAFSEADLVGDSVCLQCHTGTSGYLATAHERTSAVASAATIDGSFAPGENVLATSNPYLHYRMEETATGPRQNALQPGDPETTIASEAMDVVVGSGRKGQTYLYWRDDRLFQLPVSHWTGIGWANSPGYPDGLAIFNRPVNPRCLECHATYAEARPSPAGANRYDTTSVVLGISCESCHGAGREHVESERRREPLDWLRGNAIVNPAELSRERQVEGCALCHGGIGEPVQPPFSYRPGERLSAYLHQPDPAPDEAIDVHGNQVALLARSPCFTQTEMTCSSCHDVHRPQRDLREFSAVCTSCHTPGEAVPEGHGAAMPGNCVDCHMPEMSTNVIVANGAAGSLRPKVRTHWIRVYPGVAAGGEGR